MPKYKVSQEYDYDLLVIEDRSIVISTEVDADDEIEASKIARKIIESKMLKFDDYDGEIKDFNYTHKGYKYNPIIEEIPEPSEARKLELAGYTPLFDLQAVK